MNSADNNTLVNLLKRLKSDYPDVGLKKSDRFSWDPSTKTIYYDPSGQDPKWSLLHEAGHMTKQHSVYKGDLSLLTMEVEAWDEAKRLAKIYGETIEQDHIEDCLDSYRDWLYKRSQCPNCSLNGVEKSTGNYRCLNCRHQWTVTENRFCRVYRKSKTPQN